MEKYSLEKNTLSKIMFSVGNASRYPSFIDGLYPNIKVVFLPQNTTSLFEPMDQGFIAIFKANNLKKTFDQPATWGGRWEDTDAILERWRHLWLHQ